MARVSKEYDVRLKEFLDTAQHLFFQEGFYQTSVKDIIDKMGVAKGTFYHYFKSKEDLLDKLVERFTLTSISQIKKIVEDPAMTAVDKLNNFFITIRNLKMENFELMMMLMRVIYRDENLIIRHKMFKKNIEMMVPEFTKIIKQGEQEGSFSTADADETAEMIFVMSSSLNEIMVNLFLDFDKNPENLKIIEHKLEVYERSIERLLGSPKGTLSIVDRKIIDKFKMVSK